MKSKLNLLLFFGLMTFSCKSNPESTPLELRVTISNPTLCYAPFAQLGYEAKVLETGKVEIIPDLPDFDFKNGNVYDLIITKQKLISKDQDAPSFYYKVKEIISVTSNPNNPLVFDFSIDMSDKSVITYLNKTKYSILKKMAFQCESEMVLNKLEVALKGNGFHLARFKIVGSEIFLTDIK